MPSPDFFIITGAGGGIGRAIAARMIAQNAHVFALARDPDKLRDAQAEFGADRFGFALADLSQADQVDAGVAAARAWGRGRSLRGLVNNAAVFERTSFNDTNDEAWTRYFTHNLMSAVRLSRALYPDLRAAKGASVLNISSTLGLRPIQGAVAYSAFKAALNNLTTGLALEWATDQIRVNCICPGIVDTPIHPFHGRADDPDRAGAAAQHPLGRLGLPDDVAAAAAFLLSNDSSWTTGATLTVDGGIVL